MTKNRARIDATGFRRKLEKIGERLQVEKFRPELLDFFRRGLNTAIRKTPARSAALIRKNQARQYEHRVNYIPSYHTLEDPSLRVRDGVHFLFFGGKWYRPQQRSVPDEVWSAYQMLLSEHERRAGLAMQEFIAGRQQARMLYRKSWTQVGDSVGVRTNPGAGVRTSLTRRKPPEEPPKGYAQVRGGKSVLSVVAFNPFLERKTKYWQDSGKAILQGALRQHEPRFKQRFANWVSRALYAISKKNAGSV